MRNLDDLFDALSRSSFRRRFRLRGKDLDYLRDKGLPLVMHHAGELIDRRLVPGDLPNDGRQTPFRGHPVFVAQHATACCCRHCLEKWQGIPRGRALTDMERSHVLAVLERWLGKEAVRAP